MADLETQLHDDPEKYINDPTIELAWVIKATDRARVHMNLIMSVDTRQLRLTKSQAEIVTKFREVFPGINVENISDADLKGDNKPLWAEFCESFNFVEDYNMATLLRLRADGLYAEENTTIVPKIIFLAIEGARNVEGVNEKSKAVYKAEYDRRQDETGRVI